MAASWNVCSCGIHQTVYRKRVWIHENMCVFIDYDKGIIKSTHEELLSEIKCNIQLNLKVNPDNFPELIEVYNSCFSKNILLYDVQDDGFKWCLWFENIKFILHFNYQQKHIKKSKGNERQMSWYSASLVWSCDLMIKAYG